MSRSRSAATLRHPGAILDCPDCRGEGYVVVRDGEVARAARCRCVGRCPHCRDTGFVAVRDELRAPRKRCVCQTVVSRMRSFDGIGIPARHADSTRTSFVPDKQRMAAFMAVSSYLDQFRPGEENRGLVLHGDVGRGKTHLMVALLRELVFRYGVSARFVEFSHLLADLKSGFDSGRGAAAVLDPLVRVEVLAIDELGKGRNTEFEGTVVDELVSRRYNAARPILATTNYEPVLRGGRGVANAAAVQMGAEDRPGLADRVGDRVYSRLRETCDFVPLKGDDWRERRHRGAHGRRVSRDGTG